MVLIFVVALVFFVATRPNDEALDDQAGLVVSEDASTTHREAVTDHQDDSITRVVGGVTKNGDLIQESPRGKADLAQTDKKVTDDGFVKKVLSEQWIDPEGKPGRRRVRVVEADF